MRQIADRGSGRTGLSPHPTALAEVRGRDGTLPEQTSDLTYGVCANADDEGNCTYIAGVGVATFDAIPPAFITLRIPAARYAVFEHHGHVSTIRSTFDAIWRQWQPVNDALDAPFFERYGPAFDPHTGNGTVEIWVPIP